MCIRDSHGVNHPVEATQVLDFQGHTYDLCSVVAHLGETVNAGHYVTIAKHATANGSWWIYDDSDCRAATPEQVAANSVYARTRQLLKSYVLFYEKRAQA